jgi:hypothetical protein
VEGCPTGKNVQLGDAMVIVVDHVDTAARRFCARTMSDCHDAA